MEPSKIGVVIVLCAFLTFPLMAKRLNPPNQHLNIAEPTAAFPAPMSLWKQINVKGTERTSNGAKPIHVSVPSPYCLQQRVEVFKGKKGNCESMLWDTLSPVWRILEFNDTRTLLAHHESIVNCPTWGSFLIKVMERAITDPRMNPNNLQLFMKYKLALNFVMTIIFLPLIAKHKKFHKQILWLHCPSSDVYCTMEKSLSKNMITRQAKNLINDTVFPIVNPVQWLLPVDNQFVITLFDAKIYRKLKKKLSYHNELFNEGHFIDYVNPFAMDSKSYPNSGFFFMNILTELEIKLRFAPNKELWKAVVNYKRAIENTALRYRLPIQFLESLKTTGPANTTNVYENAPVFPKWLNPMKGMVFHIRLWPSSSCIELDTGKKNLTSLDASLPSVYCLQSTSDFTKLQGNCKEATEVWRKFMANAFPTDYMNYVSTKEVKKYFSTVISYFVGLHASLTKKGNDIQLRNYRLALELAVPYINLPLIAHYSKLNTKVVWLSSQSDNSLNTIISSDRPEKIDENTIVLPLVNPRLWHLPVDKENPYSVFMPDLPDDDPYAINIKPLIDLLLCPETSLIFARNKTLLEHETRGLFFMDLLFKLNKLIERAGKDNMKLKDLAIVVKNYLESIQSLAYFNHIPPSYIAGK